MNVMDHERRRSERFTSFGRITVKRKNPDGSVDTMSMERVNESECGRGYVFLGASIPAIYDEVYVEEREGVYTRLKLVWFHKVDRRTFRLGFDVVGKNIKNPKFANERKGN